MKLRELLDNVKKEKQNRPEYLKKDDNFKFEVSNLITEARMHAGITQEELSKLIGTKQPSVARWEAAVSLPSLRSLKKISDALGTYLIPPKFGFMENVKVSEVNSSNVKSKMYTLQSYRDMCSDLGEIWSSAHDSQNVESVLINELIKN